MKRLLITIAIILVAIPILMGGLLAASYYNVGEEDVPVVVVSALEQNIRPAGYDWNQPVLWGLMFKPIVKQPQGEPENIGTLAGPHFEAEYPVGYLSTVALYRGETVLWTGPAQEFASYIFVDNGEYTVEVTSDKVAEGTFGYGRFFFHAAFHVKVDPRLDVSGYSVQQGDVLAVGVLNATASLAPQAKIIHIIDGADYATDFSPVVFTPLPGDRLVAFIPISYNRAPGDYEVIVETEEERWVSQFTVVASEFERQDLTIDTTSPEITEANSAAAYQEYRDKIPPLFETADEECYWQGPFVQPAVGRVSTTYATTRYTNGSSTGSTHTGMDIAADEGAPVVAPAGGRVVMAEYLLNTGNTIVIEHGGGLKSYFYHMKELHVQQGDMVEKGADIGQVGSTGYSTGPHLHFEVRIGTQSIDPGLLLSGKSGLYYFR